MVIGDHSNGGDRSGETGQAGTMRALALSMTLLASPAMASDCTLALVLAADTSSSIDAEEYAAQMDGLAMAFRTQVLRDALLGKPGIHVRASVVHWSGYRHQEQVVPWTALTGPDEIDGFAAQIEAVPRLVDDQATALGKGLEFSARVLAGQPCDRHIIDLTGDGVNNYGIGPEYFDKRGDFDGITINGLVIRGATPDPEPYFRAEVARGPGAFVMAVGGYAGYAEAILEKLLREISPRYTEIAR